MNKIILSIITLTSLSITTSSFTAKNIYEAIESDNIQEVTKFIKDANISDNNGKTPLHVAAGKANINIIKLLIQNRTTESLNKTDKNGLTPLHYACKGDDTEAIKLILQNGSKDLINKADKFGNTPPYYACAGSKNRNSLDVVMVLLSNGANIDIKSRSIAARKPEIKEYFKLIENQSENKKIKAK
ncbi:MAG: Ankyrin repeat domain protein [candidate division TM6 bacterium GW2011_GWF2_30_66]|jgi:ankyrin repeat protein|nr:MAG: Ankyrin repeat domain protein [candidate division TM6 bacterium GW2011_GWF2_30_66]